VVALPKQSQGPPGHLHLLPSASTPFTHLLFLCQPTTQSPSLLIFFFPTVAKRTQTLSPSPHTNQPPHPFGWPLSFLQPNSRPLVLIFFSSRPTGSHHRPLPPTGVKTVQQRRPPQKQATVSACFLQTSPNTAALTDLDLSAIFLQLLLHSAVHRFTGHQQLQTGQNPKASSPMVTPPAA